MNVQFISRKARDITPADWEELASLTRAAFHEREAANIRMKHNQMYGIGLKNQATQDGMLLLAQHEEKTCAYILYRINTLHSGSSFAYLEIVATAPQYKRLGLGKQLYALMEAECKRQGCIYIDSDTSVNAKSSIRFHHQCGFENWSYTHFAHTNDYSICFRKYLDVAHKPRLHFLTRWKSWLHVHLSVRKSGQMGFLARLKRHIAGDISRECIQGKEISLRETQQIAYKILDEFAQFCRTYNLRYMLCYGSLLGAVRHKGFIPWDDDVDVTMPLPDYQKFISLFEANNINPHLEVLYGVKKNAIIPFAMLCDKRTAVLAGSRDKEHTHPVAIDIFPAFAIDDDNQAANQQIEQMVDYVCMTHKCLNIARPNLLKYAFRLSCNGIVSEHLLNKIQSLMNQHEWGSTKRIRILSLGERQLMALPSDAFDTTIECCFEAGTYHIPAQYHELLSENYGNYMELPPENQRTPFSSKVLVLPPHDLTWPDASKTDN